MDGRDVAGDPGEPAGQARVEVRAGAVRLDDVRAQRPEPARQVAERRRRHERPPERHDRRRHADRLEPGEERARLGRDDGQLEPLAVEGARQLPEVDFASRPSGGLRHVSDAEAPHGRRAEASREALAIQRPPETACAAQARPCEAALIRPSGHSANRPSAW